MLSANELSDESAASQYPMAQEEAVVWIRMDTSPQDYLLDLATVSAIAFH